MSNKTIQYVIAVLLAIGAAFYWQQDQGLKDAKVSQRTNRVTEHRSSNTVAETSHALNSQSPSLNNAIRTAYDARRSDVPVEGIGVVQKVLPDDNDGSRHQKIILKLDNGLSVLVAHNIDLAPRVKNIQQGDTLRFYGEYEYNPKGGVVHWTHHDPQGRHRNGWLQYKGRLYQ